LATSVGIEGLCSMSGWQARHFSELPVHITGCQGASPSHTIIDNAPGVGGWGGSCTCPDGTQFQVGDNGDLCQSLACIGGTTGTCHQHMGEWSNRKVICALATSTTTTTTITAPAFESFKGPGSEYCAEDGMISESGSLGQHDCESRCTAHPACNYISLWASGGLSWCRLNTACEIFSQQSGHTINIFEKAMPPGRRLAQLQMDVSGGSVFV